MKKFERDPKGRFVQVKKELYRWVSLSEFINLWPVLAPRAIDCSRSIEKLKL